MACLKARIARKNGAIGEVAQLLLVPRLGLVNRLKCLRQHAEVVNFLDWLSQLNQPCLQQFLNALLRVEHDHITQLWIVLITQALNGDPVSLGFADPLWYRRSWFSHAELSHDPVLHG